MIYIIFTIIGCVILVPLCKLVVGFSNYKRDPITTGLIYIKESLRSGRGCSPVNVEVIPDEVFRHFAQRAFASADRDHVFQKVSLMSQFYENLDLHVQTIHAAMTGVRGMFEDEVTALIGTYGVRLSQAAVEDDSIRAMTVKNVDGMTRFIEALDDAERARLSLYAQEYRDLDSRTGMILLCPGDFSSEDCLKIIRRLEHQHVSSAKRLEVARKEISESLTKDEQEHSVRTFELMLRAERLWLLIRQSDSATMRGGVA